MDWIGFEPGAQALLVARSREGDGEAIGALYDRTFSFVYGFAFRLSGNREDAEDVTSETYERAFRNLGRYQSRDVPIEVWLARIARNVAREHARASRKVPVVPLSQQLIDGLPASDRATAEAGASQALLAALSPAQREVIALRLAGFKLREIAEALGKAEGTIKALQHAAIRNLRKVAGG